MHDVPTLSHETPLNNNQGNKPTEQGIEPPQQQRHHQNHGDVYKRQVLGQRADTQQTQDVVRIARAVGDDFAAVHLFADRKSVV